MRKGKILVVEDDSDIREGVRILLESEEYEVIEAENGVVGLKLLDETIDLVILDIMMPKLNGLKVCEEIRKTSNVPVLFLTAKSQESDKLLGLMVGGDDYLFICRTARKSQGLAQTLPSLSRKEHERKRSGKNYRDRFDQTQHCI